ncbi:MAG TPA: hypothetical protein VK771_04125 [Acidimicrobiia bacterium]|jgi:hypothetical protein|nr:hypothetical protein [Acidimicrobiia bacterium]
MGIAHRYIDSEDLIVTVWHGVVTWDQWAAVVRQQVGDPTWSYGRRRLTDASTADTSDLTADHVDAISAIYGATANGIAGTQLAIVGDDVSTLAEHVERSMAALRVTTFIFNSIQIACAWLGVDPDIADHTIIELRAELDAHIAPRT